MVEPLTLSEIQAEVNEIQNILIHGCSDGYCQIVPKSAVMHTNGGCRCSPRALSKRLFDLALELEKYGLRRFDYVRG